jgi:hypothetical protein
MVGQVDGVLDLDRAHQHPVGRRMARGRHTYRSREYEVTEAHLLTLAMHAAEAHILLHLFQSGRERIATAESDQARRSVASSSNSSTLSAFHGSM